MKSLETFVSCLDDYDPNALAVEKAREIVRSYVTPIAVNEKVAVRAGLGRVLGADIVSTMNVPAHDNSAMDGWAVRADDLEPSRDTHLREIGSSFAGRRFAGQVGKGECVRVMTGAVMPAGTDTVVIQEVVRVEGRLDERTRMVDVVVRVKKPYARKPPLAIGLFVTVYIEGRTLPDAAVIPRIGLRQGAVVWLVDQGGRLRFRKVQVAYTEGEDVMIESGLQDGELVVISTLKTVTDGMAVRNVVLRGVDGS